MGKPRICPSPLSILWRGARGEAALVFIFLFFLSSPASAQFTLLYQIDGDTANIQLGYSVASAGDVNGDGRADFIVGARFAAPGGLFQAGAAYVYSGADGALLYQKDAAAAGDNFGISVGGAGDVNSDGKADFIVGAPHTDPGGLGNAGSAYVYSGATGTLLFQKDGAAAGDVLGVSVAGAGDVNGDGRADFIVSAYGADPGGLGDAGSAYVYSGATGTLLFQKDGAAAGDQLGSSVAEAGDVDGDGKADFIVGANRADPGGLGDAGSAYVYSGATGTLLFQKDGAAAGDVLGVSVAGAGDVNGDGKADFIIGVLLADPGGRIDAGFAFVYSGATGTLLFQKDGAAAGDELGWSVAGAGDVNGDGRADFIIGARFADPGGIDAAGSAYIYSGTTGLLLFQKDGVVADDALGLSVAVAGDVNGDGRADVIIGAPGADPGGFTAAGSAFVYSLLAPPDPPVNLTPIYQKNGDSTGDYLGLSVAGTGDVNGDGKDDFIVGAPGATYLTEIDCGRVFIYSGSNGSLYFQRFGGPGDSMGVSVAGAGDVDGDGKHDIIFGGPTSPLHNGAAFVYSPFSGSLLYQKTGGGLNEHLGNSVAGVGDVNGDGKGDFIIGAIFANPGGRAGAGSAYVYSGADGALLFQKDGAAVGDQLGFSVAGMGDVNGDGRADFIVGAAWADPGGKDHAGSAYLYSGATGLLLYQIDGAAFGDNLGVSVAGAGDVNGDGKADFMVGASNASPGGRSQAGSAYLYSGASGSLLFQKDGATAGDGFGASVASAGDVNGDGRADFIVGTPFADPGGRTNAGSVFLYSGASGALLYQKDGADAGDLLGYSVAGARDVNGDGKDDIIIGAPNASGNSGLAFVFAVNRKPLLAPLGTPTGTKGQLLNFTVSASDSDGFLPMLKVDSVTKPAGAAFADTGNGGGNFVWTPTPSQVGVHHVRIIASDGFLADTQLVTITVLADTLKSQKNGSNVGDQLGFAVSGGGDVDGDGVADYIIGAPFADVGVLGEAPVLNDAGSAYVYSGKNDTLIYQKNGSFAGERVGGSVGLYGDVNLDGRADFIVGAPGRNDSAGAAYVYSGLDSSLLDSVKGVTPGDRVGGSVGISGDVNSDGHTDFIVGAPGVNSSTGAAYVYSGIDGSPLYQKIGSSPGDRVGGSVGIYGVYAIIGAPGTNSSTGTVFVDSGATGVQVFQKNGTSPGERVGGSVGIYTTDFIVGAPGTNNFTGSAFVYSVSSGSLRFQVNGSSPSDRVGGSVGISADVNRDGFNDFIVGAPGVNDSAGAVFVYSGLDSSILFQNFGDTTGERVGGSVGIFANANGSEPRILVGAPGADPNNMPDAGSAFIFQPVKKGDLNGDGILTAADVVCLLNCTFLGLANPPCRCDLDVADIDCNGILTAADVVKELNLVFLGIFSNCSL